MIIKTFKSVDKMNEFILGLYEEERQFNSGREICPMIRKKFKDKEVSNYIKFLVSDRSMVRVLKVDNGKSVRYWFYMPDIDVFLNGENDVK